MELKPKQEGGRPTYLRTIVLSQNRQKNKFLYHNNGVLVLLQQPFYPKFVLDRDT
jgi:hypothetical protein